jgi:carbamoyl-phosphate synthase/aspartate carbamoyltransferase
MKTNGSGAMFNTGAARGGSPHKFGEQRYASSSSLIDGVEGGPSKPCEAPVQATLVLKDGQRLEGTSFGAKVNRPGEVVFNTGMVGYPEALTDPSYRGQILVLTFPLVGNYGVPSMDTKDKWDLPLYFESDDVQIAGLVVSNYSADPSHWASQQSLGNWLAKAGVPAIFGVDTRALTKGLRERGSILGRLEVEGAPPSPPAEVGFVDPNLRNLVAEVSTKSIRTYNEGSDKPTIVAIDCGMKHNIVRYFVETHDVTLIVVPFDYDLEANPANLKWDGLFCSNGPGDPSQCKETIKSLQWAISQDIPIFGICLGNQLLALAAGAKTYKMKYGNRGMNQPCVDLRTTRCYITSQNHGYAVDDQSLPEGWKALFVNANDRSNEGIIHVSKPFFSVQFHPEAAGGPFDTAFLFEAFVRHVRGAAPQLTLLDPAIYRNDRASLKRVLLVGSGGLSIGQAGEFDYSGSQAIKALKEEGIEVVLINPNIATVQTSREDASSVDVERHKSEPIADHVYLLPVTADNVRHILDKEKNIDGIIVSMGGQTALNVGIELWRNEDLQRRGIRVLGTKIDAIVATEDREIFSTKLREINETLALSYPATTVEGALEAAHKIGYPVLVRAAFTLGGLGSGFAENDAELRDLAVLTQREK